MTPNSEIHHLVSTNPEINLGANNWASPELGASRLKEPKLPDSDTIEHLELLMEQLQMVQHIANQGHWLTTTELAMVLNLPLNSLQQIVSEVQQNISQNISQNNDLEPVYTFPWRNFYCQLMIESGPNFPDYHGQSAVFWQIVPRRIIPNHIPNQNSSVMPSAPKLQYMIPKFDLMYYPAATNYATPSPQTTSAAIDAPATPQPPASVLLTENNAFIESPTKIVPVPFLQIDDFLSWQQLRDLFRYTIAQESNFVGSINTNGDENYRRSQVLYQFPEFESLIKTKLSSQIEVVCHHLKIPNFVPLGIEAQLTAHNDGHFYKLHNDNGSPDTMNRILTYVYYFHREPKGFSGGELVLYDGAMRDNAMFAARSFHTIQPRNNSIVFFPSHFMHEVLPITCASREFRDSRFTINGWVRSA